MYYRGFSDLIVPEDQRLSLYLMKEAYNQIVMGFVQNKCTYIVGKDLEVDVEHNLEKYMEFSILITTMLNHAKDESSKFFNHSFNPLIPH